MAFDDYTDIALAAVYALGSAVGLGLFGLEGLELLGITLSETLTAIGGYDIAYHHALAGVGLVGAYAVNQPQWSRLEDEAKLLIGVSVAILAVSIASPDALSDMLTEEWHGIVVFALQGGGYWGIAHN